MAGRRVGAKDFYLKTLSNPCKRSSLAILIWRGGGNGNGCNLFFRILEYNELLSREVRYANSRWGGYVNLVPITVDRHTGLDDDLRWTGCGDFESANDSNAMQIAIVSAKSCQEVLLLRLKVGSGKELSLKIVYAFEGGLILHFLYFPYKAVAPYLYIYPIIVYGTLSPENAVLQGGKISKNY
jgi:hypothetical protein